MSSPLQKSPVGLLGLLDLKTLGRNPTEFSDEVKSVLDVLDFYRPCETIENFTVPAPIVDGTSGWFDVPQNEVWLVRSLGGSIALSVGDMLPDGFSLSGAWKPGTPQNSFDHAVLFAGEWFPVTAALTHALTYRAAHWFDKPLLAPAGSRLEIIADAEVVPALPPGRVIRFNATIHRFPL